MEIVVEFLVLTRGGSGGFVLLLGFALLEVVFGSVELLVEGGRRGVREQKSRHCS